METNKPQFTAKQRELLRCFAADKLKFINILHGAVRSGKTYISLVLWAFWVATMPREEKYLMCAKSLQTLKQNCLLPLLDLVGEANFRFSLGAKEGWLFGRRVRLEGASDARAEGKIRGMTLQGAYCDELTLFDEEFFSMLLTRLSMPEAKLIATTNPDSPQHWLKVKYLDRQDELDLFSMTFNIDENTFLPPDFVERTKSQYNTGVFYDRFILGKWVKAEGLIYPFFNEDCETDEIILPGTPGWDFFVSCDYGTLNPCAMLLWAVNEREKRAVVMDEFYYSGRGQDGPKTDAEYYGDLVNLTGLYKIDSVVIDPSAASFITEIRKHYLYSVRKGDNDVVEGIRCTGTMLKNGRVKVNKRCKNLIQEFGLYVWDEESNSDRPIKENDHAMDALRYMCFTTLRRKGW